MKIKFVKGNMFETLRIWNVVLVDEQGNEITVATCNKSSKGGWRGNLYGQLSRGWETDRTGMTRGEVAERLVEKYLEIMEEKKAEEVKEEIAVSEVEVKEEVSKIEKVEEVVEAEGSKEIMFSAWVKDKETKELIRINSEYRYKKDFIEDLRGNGYMVNPIKVKPKEVFDYIMDHTNCTPWDWIHWGLSKQGEVVKI